MKNLIASYRTAIKNSDFEALIELQKQVSSFLTSDRFQPYSDEIDQSTEAIAHQLKELYQLNRDALMLAEAEQKNLGQQLGKLKGAKAYGAV